MNEVVDNAGNVLWYAACAAPQAESGAADADSDEQQMQNEEQPSDNAQSQKELSSAQHRQNDSTIAQELKAPWEAQQYLLQHIFNGSDVAMAHRLLRVKMHDMKRFLSLYRESNPSDGELKNLLQKPYGIQTAAQWFAPSTFPAVCRALVRQLLLGVDTVPEQWKSLSALDISYYDGC